MDRVNTTKSQVEVSEKRLQQDCFTWFHNNFPDLRGLLWMTHNQAVNKKQGAILKAMGMVSGVSDLILFHGGEFFAIELKTETGKQSDSQKKWQRMIEKHGGQYYIVRSLSDFQLLILHICV